MSQEQIVIEIWSDVICPFCWLGKRRLEKALKATPSPERFVVVHRPFRLNPDAPRMPILQMMRTKYGLDESAAERNFAGLRAQGLAEGIEFHFAGTFLGDSIDAHRLILWSGIAHRQNEILEKLHRAYFTEGRDIFDREVLLEIAVGEGLDAQDAKDMLDSDRFIKQVTESEAEAHSLGVRGVPFFVFKGEYAIGGAQPEATFRQALSQFETP